jgi:hypothetical protein
MVKISDNLEGEKLCAEGSKIYGNNKSSVCEIMKEKKPMLVFLQYLRIDLAIKAATHLPITLAPPQCLHSLLS